MLFKVLKFESPGHFFGQPSEKCREIIRAAQGKGELSVRELARVVGRDVKRVLEDVVVLAGLGLHVIRMPEHYGELSPMLHVVPLPLLA